jgi:hypothetical protein
MQSLRLQGQQKVGFGLKPGKIHCSLPLGQVPNLAGDHSPEGFRTTPRLLLCFPLFPDLESLDQGGAELGARQSLWGGSYLACSAPVHSPAGLRKPCGSSLGSLY